MESILQINKRSDYLKIIAMVTMLIDHIAYFLLPHGTTTYYIMRLIGRIAYPIFAYYVAMGFKNTKNLNKYILRMLIFALITQIPFYYFAHKTFYLNVMFTFFLALIMLMLFERKNLLWVLVFFLADVAHTDYGAYGLAIVLIFYLYSEEMKKVFIWLLVVSLIYNSLDALKYSSLDWRYFLQTFCVVSVPVIYFNYKYIRINKYISYMFYPVHIGLIVLFKFFAENGFKF